MTGAFVNPDCSSSKGAPVTPGPVVDFDGQAPQLASAWLTDLLLHMVKHVQKWSRSTSSHFLSSCQGPAHRDRGHAVGLVVCTLRTTHSSRVQPSSTIPQIPHIHENGPDETKHQWKGLSRVGCLPIHKSGRIGRHHGFFMCKTALLLLRLAPLGCAERH
ncbi:hypothetical protein BJY00DRAFT_83531 [Aspergillus carlsbadensis]|nr:hypothetical protein BJY00DRAFT_83531 [Aspergillus carlsbadensis]